MGARGSRHVVSPWDRSRAVAGRRGGKGKITGATGGMRQQRDGSQWGGTAVLQHGLTLKPFEGEAVCASMDVNIGVVLWHHDKYVACFNDTLHFFMRATRAHCANA